MPAITEEARLNHISETIIGGAIEVHRALGPGLLESAYEACLAFELAERGLKVHCQKALPVVYRDVQLDCGYRLDLLVEDKVIVEIKAVDRLAAIHHAQLLSYLKLSGCKLGLLINLNVPVLKEGIRRVVNDFPDAQRSQRKISRCRERVMEATRSAQRAIPLKGWLDEVLVILLVIVALLLGWVVRNWVQGRTVTFSSDDAAVSLRYPAGWLQQTDKDTLLTVSDVRAKGSFKPSFSLATREMNPDYPLTASDVLVSLSVQRAANLTAYRVLNVDEGTVDGLGASRLTYAYVSEPEGGLQAFLPVVVEAVDWVVLREGSAYVFSFSAPADEFSQQLGVFSSIMGSVDFR